MNRTTYRQYAAWVALGTGCLFLPNAIRMVLADPSVVNKMIDPLKALAIIQERVRESLNIAAGAKIEVTTNALTASELAWTADTWNAQSGGSGAISKYVQQVQIDNTTGEVEVMFNNATIGAISASSTLVYIPYVQAGGSPMQLQAALAAGVTGNIDWGCASFSNAIASSYGLPAIKMGTLLSKFAPNECR